MSRHETKFWTECALAVASGALFALTLVTREWIELVFRVDPDHGSGALEWAAAGALVALTVAFALAARAERRRVFAVAG
jgi:hypothetical protein